MQIVLALVSINKGSCTTGAGLYNSDNWSRALNSFPTFQLCGYQTNRISICQVVVLISNGFQSYNRYGREISLEHVNISDEIIVSLVFYNETKKNTEKFLIKIHSTKERERKIYPLKRILSRLDISIGYRDIKFRKFKRWKYARRRHEWRIPKGSV